MVETMTRTLHHAPTIRSLLNLLYKIVFLFGLSDTENIRFVFAAVKDTILQLNLKEYNLV